MAVETIFGWVLSGELNETGCNPISTVMLSSASPTMEEAYQQLQRMIDIESLEYPGQSALFPQQHPALFQFENSVTFNDSRYQVELPWKQFIQPLPSNFLSIKQQLIRLVSSLERHPGQLERYGGVISELIERGFVEIVNPVSSQQSDRLHYIAHHGVYDEERATTKLRVVFNASGKKKGFPSLNDCLDQGPNLVPQLAAILLRFRLFRIAVTADMEKAFHQIGIHPKDRENIGDGRVTVMMV